jgi:hypothetical protein
VPLDMLKTEMTRLTREKVDAENELTTATATLTDLAGQLKRALAVAGSCNQHYAAAPARIRQQINQGLFKALYLDRDGSVEHVELTEPFAQLLADDLLSNVSAQAALTGEPAEQNDTWADAANRTRPFAVLHTVITSDQTHKTPQQDLLGRGLTTSVWCRRWDSNPHWRVPRTRASAVGLRRRSVTGASGAHRIRRQSPRSLRSLATWPVARTW